MYALTSAALNNTAPMPGVSKNYEFMPTTRIIDVMERDGYEVVSCSQGKSRKPNGQYYAKHLVKFRKARLVADHVAPEVLVLNSHNRGAALQFFAGFFRFACANGMIIGDVISQSNKIYHTNRNPFDLVLDRAAYATQVIDSKLEVIKEMRETILDQEQMYDFAEKATQLAVFKNRTFMDSRHLILPKRSEDTTPTTWNIFNRIQENIKKGDAIILGVSGKMRKARPIKNIDTDIKYNQQLWNLAEEYI